MHGLHKAKFLQLLVKCTILASWWSLQTIHASLQYVDQVFLAFKKETLWLLHISIHQLGKNMSIWWSFSSFCTTNATSVCIDSYLTTGQNVSSYSTPNFWENSCVTRRPLWCSITPSVSTMSLKRTAFRSLHNSTKFQTSFALSDCISLLAALSHFALSGLIRASVTLVTN